MRSPLFRIGILVILAYLSACSSEPSPTAGRNAASTKAPPTPAMPAPRLPNTAASSIPMRARSSVRQETIPLATARATEKITQTQPAEESVIPSLAPPNPAPGGSGSPDEVDAIRLMAKEYWAALNDYDAHRALPMLEPGYRAEEEEQIRKDIGRMKIFRVKLGVSEDTPPTLNEDGDYETYINLETPIDTRRVLMRFSHINNQWLITYSDEVE